VVTVGRVFPWNASPPLFTLGGRGSIFVVHFPLEECRKRFGLFGLTPKKVKFPPLKRTVFVRRQDTTAKIPLKVKIVWSKRSFFFFWVGVFHPLRKSFQSSRRDSCFHKRNPRSYIPFLRGEGFLMAATPPEFKAETTGSNLFPHSLAGGGFSPPLWGAPPTSYRYGFLSLVWVGRLPPFLPRGRVPLFFPPTLPLPFRF